MIGKKAKIALAGLGLTLGGGFVVGSAFGGPSISSASSSSAAVSADSATIAKTATIAVDDTTTVDDGTATDADADGDHAGRPESTETPLEGDVAAKVTAAAEAAVPGGTVERVETDDDGVYEAHVTTADGTEVIVQVGEDFTVTATLEHPMGGRGGHRGGPGGGAGETPLEGDVAASVTAAAQAAVPDGTIDRVETDNDGVYEAHVTQADGTEVVVKIDESFAVTGTEEMGAGGGEMGHGPGGPGGRGGHHGDDADDDAAGTEVTDTTTA